MHKFGDTLLISKGFQ